MLIDDSKPINGRLHEVLDPNGRFRVGGAGLNFISKVLAVHDPSKYTVFNGPVADVLGHFNYEIPRGYTPSEKYLEFAEMMRRFLRECGADNTLDLDAFFYNYWARIKKKTDTP